MNKHEREELSHLTKQQLKTKDLLYSRVGKTRIKNGGHHLYKRLGVNKYASRKQIRKKYKKLKTQRKLTKKIREAYKVLSNKKSRRRYNWAYNKKRRKRSRKKRRKRRRQRGRGRGPKGRHKKKPHAVGLPRGVSAGSQAQKNTLKQKPKAHSRWAAASAEKVFYPDCQNGGE